MEKLVSMWYKDQSLPENYKYNREVVGAYSTEAKKLGSIILKLIADGLGPESGYFKNQLGYALQIISNNKVKSEEHRAVRNSKEAGTSAAFSMEKAVGSMVSQIFENLVCLIRKFIFCIPNHIAFIMDGNRRYAKKRGLMEGVGHKVGFLALMSMLRCCHELGVRYVTVYAFSIDNFKRSPKEVQSLMELMQEKIDDLIKEESIVNRFGLRIYFIGNLKLLSKPVRLAAERAMLATAKNSKSVLCICVAYTSTNEIVNAVKESIEEKWDELSVLNASGAGYGLIKLGGSEGDEREQLIKLIDIEKHMYMAVAPEPDIIIRTSGEIHLSNFLLWQSAVCYLYSPSVLWPEVGFHHFLWEILNFQRNHSYLYKKWKQQ
ncbi:dehydrodolichyl diphosphate synthase CPT3-like [Citrus sinensis]|uniref:dehydrodolichyl diphosphate synthase CPT3-like n=1 Tax=Citrus sinensis TaxID=2711 RepID=UPI002279A12A|nr:dehydrodolichyl diphosphate synthase CPT3-like [Citrus sinensis]